MASEVIKLNLIPTGTMPVFHASQFDTGRLITCELYRGEDAYSVPEGYTVELHCRKVDNNIVTMASTLINDNVVTFTSTEQLTACNGNNLCEVAILDEGYRIGTLNFILEVEVDPLKGGITSTSEIHNLESQIEEITTEIIGENYYDKSEVDDLLSAKADSDSVYTIGEVNTLLSGKANAADVYTKRQTDILLNAKADVSDLPDMTDYYTKTATDALLDDKASNTYVDSALALKANVADVYTKAETDAKIEEAIEEILPVDTAGPSAIASFTTGLALPLVNCTVGITATGGNGTPDNPIPINGYTEANITRCGVNLFDGNTFVDTYSTKYELASDGSIQTIGNLQVGSILFDNVSKKSGSYYIYFKAKYENTGYVGIRPQIKYTDGTTQTLYPTNTQDYSVLTYTTDNNKTVSQIVVDYGTNNKSNFYLQVSTSSQTEYHDYNGQTYTVNFGQTVYGGVPDVTRGKLHVTWGSVDLGSLNWFYRDSGTALAPYFWCYYSGIKTNGAAYNVAINALCANYTTTKRTQDAFVNNCLCGDGTATEIQQIQVKDNRFTNANDFKTAVNGVLLAYELATPFDIDLTPEVISAVVGTNNVYSDTNGDTTVKFKDTIQNYIDKKVSA